MSMIFVGRTRFVFERVENSGFKEKWTELERIKKKISISIAESLLQKVLRFGLRIEIICRKRSWRKRKFGNKLTAGDSCIGHWHSESKKSATFMNSISNRLHFENNGLDIVNFLLPHYISWWYGITLLISLCVENAKRECRLVIKRVVPN